MNKIPNAIIKVVAEALDEIYHFGAYNNLDNLKIKATADKELFWYLQGDKKLSQEQCDRFQEEIFNNVERNLPCGIEGSGDTAVRDAINRYIESKLAMKKEVNKKEVN